MVVLNAILLLVDIIFYSIFLYSCRKDGKIIKYIVLGIIITVLALIVGTNSLLSYLLLVMTFLLGLKYIVKVKTSLYDMFIIIVMLFTKVSLELIPFVIFYVVMKNYSLVYILMIILKLLFLVVTKNNLYLFYKRMKKLWLNNVFKIRYIFICCTYIYVIITALCLLNFR